MLSTLADEDFKRTVQELGGYDVATTASADWSTDEEDRPVREAARVSAVLAVGLFCLLLAGCAPAAPPPSGQARGTIGRLATAPAGGVAGHTGLAGRRFAGPRWAKPATSQPPRPACCPSSQARRRGGRAGLQRAAQRR